MQLSISEQFRRQAGWCDNYGSPFYAYLLAHCAADCEKGGLLSDILHEHENDPADSALPLRFLGSVHRLVLEGRAPALSKFYPSVGGLVEYKRVWEVFHETVRAEKRAISNLVRNPVQTNDVGRSGSLLGGFGLVAERTGLPLYLLEIGASAGLNLRWDQYRYEWRGGEWGSKRSSVRLENVFIDGAPSMPRKIRVVGRSGCDISPVDINSAAGCTTLLSYTWADQVDRIRRLKAAIEIARRVALLIHPKGAADWLEDQLRERRPGITTVVFHSLVWPYLSQSEQGRVIKMLEIAGNEASERAPFAWLTMEPKAQTIEVRLRIYPGFPEQVVATTNPHSPSVRWLSV